MLSKSTKLTSLDARPFLRLCFLFFCIIDYWKLVPFFLWETAQYPIKCIDSAQLSKLDVGTPPPPPKRKKKKGREIQRSGQVDYGKILPHSGVNIVTLGVRECETLLLFKCVFLTVQ